MPAFQFGSFAALFTDPQYLTVPGRTLRIALAVSVPAGLPAYPFAYFLVKHGRSARLRTWLYIAVTAPLRLSYLLRAYIWKIILGTEGVLSSFLLWKGIISQPSSIASYNQFAMAVTLTYIFIPFIVMPIYTALENIPPSRIEASHDLGLGP